jgi:hypothetical protein
MEIIWPRVLPVIVSILIIITVAVVREYSRPLAAVLATMPINIPLALWLVYSGPGGDMEPFTRALLINILPTLVFLLIVWLAARAGWGLLPMLATAYAGWGVGLGLVLILRQALGV